MNFSVRQRGGERSTVSDYGYSEEGCYLRATTAAAHAASCPQLPGLATPVVNLDGAAKVGLNIARSSTAAAALPVHLVDLPETSVIAAVAVLVAGVGVAARLVLDDAVAAFLAPAVLGAPGAHIDGSVTTADVAVVASGVVNSSKSKSCKSEHNKDGFHYEHNKKPP